MPDKVTLVRPDGSSYEVAREDADKFQALGYAPESAQQTHNRGIQAGEEEYFTGAGQRTKAGLEGFVNGLTMGGYTTLLGDDEEADRARYNPGTRMGGEIVGSLLPSLIPGGAEAEAGRLGILGKTLSKTPVGMLTEGAEAIAGATATKTGHALVRGAVEGAGFGAAAAATDAKLSGDPVTAEAVLAGMGWGALWGGGLGYVSGKVGVHAEKAAAEAAAELAAKNAPKAGAISEDAWNGFRNVINDVKKTSTGVVDDAVSKIADSQEARDTLTAHVLTYADELEAQQGALFNRIDVKGGMVKRGAKGLKKELLQNQKAITRAVNDGNYEQFETLTKRHANVMGALADLTKQARPELEPFILGAAAKGAKAIDGLKGAKAVADSLDGLPFTPEGFLRMTPKKVESLSGAVNKFLKDAPEELAGQKESLKRAVDDLFSAAGLQSDTMDAGQKLRNAHEILKNSGSKGSQAEAEKLKSGGFGHSTAKYVGGITGARAAQRAGGGIIGRGLGYEAGAKIMGGLIALKTGVMGTIAGHAAKWAPAVAKVGKFVGPKIDPLKVRLDGTLEEANKSRKQLMMERMKEMRDAAPTINDTLYRAVEPIAGEHTDLAVNMNKAAVNMFNSLMARMPRDPGHAFANMKSLWSPDPVMTEQFARSYEVFQNPVGTMVRWLKNPKSITPEGASALKQFNPELFQLLRGEMMQRLGEPGVLEKMTYSEQVGMGQLLDLRIHSTQDPKFIQAQQAMYQERNEPLPARPSAGSNNSNNPSGTSPGMTTAQRVTQH